MEVGAWIHVKLDFGERAGGFGDVWFREFQADVRNPLLFKEKRLSSTNYV